MIWLPVVSRYGIKLEPRGEMQTVQTSLAVVNRNCYSPHIQMGRQEIPPARHYHVDIGAPIVMCRKHLEETTRRQLKCQYVIDIHFSSYTYANHLGTSTLHTKTNIPNLGHIES